MSKVKNQIETKLCSFVPNIFWNRNKHFFFLSYIVGFDENQIPIKARPIQMNQQILEYGKKDIQNLLDKNLIRKSHSPWNCVAFYVKKPLKIERNAQDL